MTAGQLQGWLLLGLAATVARATEVVWPTSMDRSQLRSPADYLQPTESGRLESGAFGMVRDDGHRFHEGLDIRPAGRTKSGEPTDLVFSAMEGVAVLREVLARERPGDDVFGEEQGGTARLTRKGFGNVTNGGSLAFGFLTIHKCSVNHDVQNGALCRCIHDALTQFPC